MQPSLPATSSSIAPAQPFVKWAGGKRKLIDDILRAAPRHYDRYLEPFLGGGAVALSVPCLSLLLNDANEELINAYSIVRDQLDELLSRLNEHLAAHSEEYFYNVRDLIPSELSPLDNAARFIYLNKACFNGLYRVNQQGGFNVPYGRHKNISLYDKRNMTAVSQILQRAQLHTGDYKNFLQEHARAGDFIYLDPPYAPISKFSDFKRYTKNQFKEKEQQELSVEFQRLIDIGAYPILSNSYSDFTLGLYSRYNTRIVHMTRNINNDAKGRAAIREILVTRK